jgi:hypothetical protein
MSRTRLTTVEVTCGARVLRLSQDIMERRRQRQPVEGSGDGESLASTTPGVKETRSVGFDGLQDVVVSCQSRRRPWINRVCRPRVVAPTSGAIPSGRCCGVG